MGDKKQKEASQKKWKKVLFVAAAILFIVVMVVSSTGSRWITGIAPVRAGDKVVLDYTIYNSAGVPLVTSDQQKYKQIYSSGASVLYGQQLTITANQSFRQAIYPINVYIASNGGSYEQFALYNPEFGAVSSGVVGMRTGDKKNIVFTQNTTLTTMFSPNDLANVGVNMSALSIGDMLAMGVSESSNASTSNTSVSYIRLGEVTRKTPSGVVVDFGYPYAEITVSSFSSQ